MRVLVTGAASGIGRATARRLAAGGARLYLTDIRQDALDAEASEIRAKGGCVVLAEAVDVSDYAAVVTFADHVHQSTDALDAVINAAGIATWGTVSALSHDQWQRVVDVNLMGPIHVIESFVPRMVDAGRGGHLVNVSSAAGLIGLPWHAAYSASKFGLRGVSEVLRFDLARHRIAVTLVCPGGVDTPLADSVTVAGVDQDSEALHALRARFRRHAVSADHAAKAIVSGMLARRYLVYTSNDIRLIHAVQRYVPPLYALIMRMANRAADVVAARVAAS
ncbi:short-subunit dehydrogenase [Actinocrispum wychmicini]|uniref:Short-subunit dehydrogenase n=2 Tax=Actinocrispum wychmicini TaxID=1213861 RepID=A0A4R2JUC0_9PSEU|nr:short-subunit dehydrogenase [Actinocrispum wychmicini]